MESSSTVQGSDLLLNSSPAPVPPQPEPPAPPAPPASQGSVLLKFFLTSVAMFSLPFVAFFITKHYCEEDFDMKPPKSFIYPAISAVIVVQVIIFSYVYIAFIEDEKKNNKKNDWYDCKYNNSPKHFFVYL